MMLPLPFSRDLEEVTKIYSITKELNEPWVIPVLILQTYGAKLPEPIFHEIIRRAGCIWNNDALYKNSLGQTIIIKEGEGSFLQKQSYYIMSKNPNKYFIQDAYVLNDKQKEEFFIKFLKYL
jgi:hypothetical protein